MNSNIGGRLASTPTGVGVRHLAKNRSVAKGSQAYLFNFAAVGVGAITIFLAVFGTRSKVIASVCSERYGVATQFSLQRSAGEPASAAELQARLGGRDWGVIENASVVTLADGPSPLVLQVNMPKTTDGNSPLGLGFTWLLADAKPAYAACLSYQVMVPADFENGQGGVLPGLFGGDTAAAPRSRTDLVKTSFGTHVIWGSDGQLSVRVASADAQDNLAYLSLGEKVAVTPGRWMAIDQELVLNTEGQSNGMLRVWIDGQLKLETFGLAWRKTDAGVFRGADVRAHFARNSLEPARGPKPTNIRLTPIETRWIAN